VLWTKVFFTNLISSFKEIQSEAPLPELLYLCLQSQASVHTWLCTLSLTGMFKLHILETSRTLSQSKNIAETDTSKR